MRAQGPGVFDPIGYSNIGYPNYDKEEADLIFWYNQIIKTVKNSDHSSVGDDFLYALRNSAKAKDIKQFYTLIATKAGDIGGNIDGFNW